MIENKLIHSFNIDYPLAKDIANRSKLIKLCRGNYLFYQDKAHNYIAFILDGTMGFHSAGEDYSDTYYSVITKGLVLNDTQLVAGGMMLTEVKAITDCEVLIMSYQEARVLLQSEPSFCSLINLSLAKKSRVYHELFLLRKEKNPYKKVEKTFNVLSKFVSGGVVPVNICSLSLLIGISRNTVGKCVKELVDLGHLSKVGRGYCVNSEN